MAQGPRLFPLALLLGFTLPLLAKAQPWNYYPPLQEPAKSGLVVGDFDGDGQDEAVFSGLARTRDGITDQYLLGVLGGETGISQQLRSATVLPVHGYWATLARGQMPNGKSFIAYLTDEPDDESHVLIYSGVPLRLQRSIATPGLIRIRAVFDPTGTGTQKALGLVEDPQNPFYKLPAIFDLASGEREWVGTERTYDVAVAPLGAGGALKLIIGSVPGRILDAGTRALEWSWGPGFGREITTGRFGQQGRFGFAAANTQVDSVDVFSSQPYAYVRTFEAPPYMTQVIAMPQAGPTGDLIGFAGRNLESPYGGKVSSYQPTTGYLVRSSLLDCGAPDAAAVGSIDGFNQPRLVYAAGIKTSAPDHLCVANPMTGTTLHDEPDESGPYSAVARGEVAGTGADELVMVARVGSDSHLGPTIRVLDATQGKVLRETRIAEAMYSFTTPRVALAQVDGDAPLEIIFAQGGGAMNDWRIEAWDGSTLQRQWRTSGFGQGFPTSLAMIDANGDGVPDALVLSSESRISLFDGRDGAELWHSISLPESTTGGVAGFVVSGVPHAAIGTANGLYLLDLNAHAFVTSVVVDGDITGVRQWGDGSSCRLALTTTSPSLGVRACDTLAVLNDWPLPTVPTAFWPLAMNEPSFLFAAAGQLHTLHPDGVVRSLPLQFDGQLAEGNQGELRALQGGSVLDLMVGSSSAVMRLQFNPDAIFVDNFEATP